jgi:hypothetical protein
MCQLVARQIASIPSLSSTSCSMLEQLGNVGRTTHDLGAASNQFTKQRCPLSIREGQAGELQAGAGHLGHSVSVCVVSLTNPRPLKLPFELQGFD